MSTTGECTSTIDETFRFEMASAASIDIQALDDLLATLEIGQKSLAELYEWRQIAEATYKAGDLNAAAALLKATICTAIYARESKQAFPLARKKVANKKSRQASIAKDAMPARHAKEKPWHATALKHHANGKTGEWIANYFRGKPSKATINRFLKKRRAPVT